MNKLKINPILVIIFLFMIISIYTIYQTISIDSTANNLFIRQFIWYTIGYFVIYLVIKSQNNIFLKSSKYLYVINNILLFLLLIFGKSINNARCWFTIPYIGNIQPSEFMKVSLILYLSYYLSKQKDNLSIKEEFFLLIKTFIIVLIPSILTFLEPDTGNVLIYLVIYFVVMFSFGIRYRFFIFIFLSIFILLLGLGLFYYNYEDLFISIFGSSLFLRIDRLLDWKSGNGFQLNKSIIAIGSSGILGNLNIPIYFPESYTDFIFSTYSSMMGYIGSFILIILFMIFDILIINISFKSNDRTNKILINGIIGMFIYQQIQNISMTFGLLPITGITLPFISYGGSSLLIFMFLIGIILNIDKDNKKNA